VHICVISSPLGGSTQVTKTYCLYMSSIMFMLNSLSFLIIMYHYYNKKILYFVYAFMHFECLHSVFCVQHQFMNHSSHKKMYASLTTASKLYVRSKSYSSICILSVIGNLIITIDSRFFASNLSSTKVSFPTATSSYSPPLGSLTYL